MKDLVWYLYNAVPIIQRINVDKVCGLLISMPIRIIFTISILIASSISSKWFICPRSLIMTGFSRDFKWSLNSIVEFPKFSEYHLRRRSSCLCGKSMSVCLCGKSIGDLVTGHATEVRAGGARASGADGTGEAVRVLIRLGEKFQILLFKDRVFELSCIHPWLATKALFLGLRKCSAV